MCVTCKAARKRAQQMKTHMRCATCGETLNEAAFDGHEVEKALKHRNRHRGLRCAACRHAGLVPTYVCSSCMRHLPAEDYHTASLEAWIEEDALWRAECLTCAPTDPTHLPYPTRALFPCNLCKEEKPRAAFRGAKQKCKDVNSWRCKECQQPPCTACGARPDAPLFGGRALLRAKQLTYYRCTICRAGKKG